MTPARLAEIRANTHDDQTYEDAAYRLEIVRRDLLAHVEELSAQKEVLRDWMARAVEYMQRNPAASGVRLLQALETEMFNEGIRPSDFGPRIDAAMQAESQ